MQQKQDIDVPKHDQQYFRVGCGCNYCQQNISKLRGLNGFNELPIDFEFYIPDNKVLKNNWRSILKAADTYRNNLDVRATVITPDCKYDTIFRVDQAPSCCCQRCVEFGCFIHDYPDDFCDCLCCEVENEYAWDLTNADDKNNMKGCADQPIGEDYWE